MYYMINRVDIYMTIDDEAMVLMGKETLESHGCVFFPSMEAMAKFVSDKWGCDEQDVADGAYVVQKVKGLESIVIYMSHGSKTCSKKIALRVSEVYGE